MNALHAPVAAGVHANGRDQLTGILSAGDQLTVTDNGLLAIDGIPCEELLDEYGSPLFVISRTTLVDNLKRVRMAFLDVWPAAVNVLYATKANNNLAVRAVLSAAGAGGDCFGLGELYAALMAGTDPAITAINGSNKSERELSAAVRVGAMINIDAVDELQMLRNICRILGTTVRVSLRLKVAPAQLSGFGSDFHRLAAGDMPEFVRLEKWGFSIEQARALLIDINDDPVFRFQGFHVHMGRLSQDPEVCRTWGEAFARDVAELAVTTGHQIKVIDIGGGWPRMRDPESRSGKLNPHPIADYAQAVTTGLRQGFGASGLPLPELWLEPGRYIAGNAGVLLAHVGAIKEDLGLRWVNLDASTNNLPRIDSAGCVHQILPASRMDEPYQRDALVVGGTCTGSLFGRPRLPELQRGDCVAVLDAGMYAETTSNQYNGLPRPATVMVWPGGSALIKRRETLHDVFGLHLVPEDVFEPGGRRMPSAVVGPVVEELQL